MPQAAEMDETDDNDFDDPDDSGFYLKLGENTIFIQITDPKMTRGKKKKTEWIRSQEFRLTNCDVFDTNKRYLVTLSFLFASQLLACVYPIAC